jgi:hypothetical protein
VPLDATDAERAELHRLAVAKMHLDNLEDIAAPRCFEIEARLRETLSIPVFHDDQHGTAIVVLAALQNALRDGRQAARGCGDRRDRCRCGRRGDSPDAGGGRSGRDRLLATAGARSTPDDRGVATAIADAVARATIANGVARAGRGEPGVA